MKEDMFTSYVEFENEDGETLTLEVVDYFEYENEMYAILMNDCGCEDDDCEDIEVCVLKVLTTDEGEEFVEPDDDKFPELQRIVEKILTEGCEDDCGCGCDHEHDHHHHHHDCDCGCNHDEN